MFIAVSITDLKLYFFLGETMKHEKGGRRGEITDTADTSKHSEGDAARRTQIAEQPDVLWDCIARSAQALFAKFESSTFRSGSFYMSCFA